jgi:hypothetical protein
MIGCVSRNGQCSTAAFSPGGRWTIDSSEMSLLGHARAMVAKAPGGRARCEADVVAALVGAHRRRSCTAAEPGGRRPKAGRRLQPGRRDVGDVAEHGRGRRGAAGAGTDEQHLAQNVGVDRHRVGDAVDLRDGGGSVGTMVGCTRCSMPVSVRSATPSSLMR